MDSSSEESESSSDSKTTVVNEEEHSDHQIPVNSSQSDSMQDDTINMTTSQVSETASDGSLDDSNMNTGQRSINDVSLPGS